MIGILFALGALLSWGFGDFLIQLSARKFGDWIALFYITIAGTVFLLPFVWKELTNVFTDPKSFWLLMLVSFIILFAALFDFEALRIGKISVVEPIYAFEIVITTTLASLIIREQPNLWQSILIGSLLIGIFLVSVKSFHHLRNIHMERGVFQAILATIGMGLVNFLFGVSARETSPMMVNWFTSLFLAAITLGYLIYKSRVREIASDWRKNRKLIASMCVFDNLAWVCFAWSTLTIPIAIATSISEAYIALAAGLGLIFNKEKLKGHQVFGMILAIASVIILSAITSR
jgi:drug/metabolite transporter (DMT)-like permease